MTRYNVVVKTRGFTYFVPRRYREFESLHKTMKQKYGINFPHFPSKVNLLKSQEAVFKDRRIGLEKFLNYLQVIASKNLGEKVYQEYFDFIEIGGTRR